MFRFIGKNSSKYNNSSSLGYFNDIANDCGVKLGYTKDSFGNRYNSIVKKSAKPCKNGYFSQGDSIANFSNAQMCSSFLNGYYAGKRTKKRK